MRIQSFSKILAFPFVLSFIVILYLTMEYDNMTLSYGLIPPVIVVTLIFVFSPQIDYWWYKDHPPALEKPIIKWLEKHAKFYIALPERRKNVFRDRLSIMIRSADFSIMAPEKSEMPEDLKAIISTNAIQLTFGMEKFLFKHFVRIVAYRHAFPSPDHPVLHTVEINIDDGVILLSLEHAIPGMLQPGKFYNIALHAFIAAHLHEHPIDFGDQLEAVGWDVLESVSGLEQKRIEAIIGLKKIEKNAVVIHHYFQYPKSFLQQLPKIYQKLRAYFEVHANG